MSGRSHGRRSLAMGNQKDSLVLLAPIHLLKSVSWESLWCLVCSEYQSDNNKVSFIKYVCGVERKLLKIKELLYLLGRDLSAPQNESFVAVCVGTPGLEVT